MKMQLYSIRVNVLLLLLFVLSGCKEKDITYFLTHPEAIQSTYDKCHKSDHEMGAKQFRECAAVLKAIPVFRSYFVQLTDNQDRYGLDVMRAEIKLVELEKKYDAACKEQDKKLVEDLKKQIAEQKLEVQSRLAMIRFMSGVGNK